MNKKMFLFAAAFGVAAFVGLTAFDGENDQQAEIDAAIETQLNDFRSEKQMECQTSALAAAQMKADSLLAKPGAPVVVKKETKPAPTKPEPKKPVVKPPKPTPPPPPPPPPVKPVDKPTTPTNTNRPGTTDGGTPATNNNRPGANNNDNPTTPTSKPSNNNRPGAN